MQTCRYSFYIMNKRIHMIWFVMLGLYFSCAGPGSTPQKSGGYKVDYEEDLSAVRQANVYQANAELKPATGATPTSPEKRFPEAPALMTNDITQDLDRLIAEVARKNSTIKSIPGYTIQVYSGTNREQANLARRQVYHVLPDARPEIKYMQPNYKVQVGQFVERLEAQKIFSMVKKEFPSALIIPDRIKINE